MRCRTGLLGLVLSIALLGFSAAATAQSGRDHTGEWQLGFSVFGQSSETLLGVEGSSLDVDSALGFGFTAGYHVTDRLTIGGDLSYSNPDYTATRIIDGVGTNDPVDTIRANLGVSTLHFTARYFLTGGGLAPYVEAGAGWTRVDSNIVDGPPTTGCWWDPWWGYICQPFFNTYAETRTSYQYGIGVRTELSRDFVLRISYSLLEVDTSYASEDASVGTLRGEFAWRF